MTNLESLRSLQKPDDCKPAMVVNGEPWWLERARAAHPGLVLRCAEEAKERVGC